jgi:hypothetical protein
MKNISSNDLLQYMYEETYLQRSLAIKTAIEVDNRVRDKYLAIQSAKNTLDEMPLLSPRKEAIDKFLDYARRSMNK